MKIYLFIVLSFILVSCATSNTTQKPESIEELIMAGKDVFIQGQTFDRDIDFTQLEKNLISESIYQVKIRSSITFVNCTFNGKVLTYSKSEDLSATLTSFQSNLSFIGCQFNDEVNFKGSSILGRADFTQTAFSKTANFEECTFFQNAYFRASIFQDELRFQNAVFMQKANFLSAEFDVTASFQHVVFHSEAQFSSSRLMGYADFGSMNCFGNFLVNHTEFADRAIFNYAYFGGRAEINYAQFNRCEMLNCRFFGVSRFAGSTVQQQISFDNSFFLLGLPDMSSFEAGKTSFVEVGGAG